MGLRLLLDEDTQAHRLVSRLRLDGHDVLTVGEAGLMAVSDAEVLALARREGRVLLTHNAADFAALHRAEADHAGIVVVYRDRDPLKDLSRDAIATCLARIEASGWALTGQFVALNAWRPRD